jgi:D-alanine-D-alanine ligase
LKLKNIISLPSPSTAIVPFKSKHPSFNKINKKIEILIVPKLQNFTGNQKNVAIVWDEHSILKILQSRYADVIITTIQTENDLKQLALRKPNLVFSGVKYFNFNDRTIWLNDYLEIHDIAYMASGRQALQNEHDKSRAKEIIQQAGINTANFFTTEPGEHLSETSLPITFPLFIKPVTGGDSRGIDSNSVVHDFASFETKVLDIKNKQKSTSLVETYLSGKEYSVAILEDSVTGIVRAMPIEIIVPKNNNGHCILDYDIKKQDEEKVISVTNSKIFTQLSILAKKAFVALGGKSLGRIDIKMNDQGEAFFIEANLMPGLSKGYFYRACFLNLHLSYEEMILLIAKNGLASSKSYSVSKMKVLETTNTSLNYL